MIRRLTEADMADAPDADYVDAIQDSVNKLNDAVSTPAKPAQIDLLKQCSVEAFEFDVQVPNPWQTMTLQAPWQNTNAGLFASYMKHYDGSVEITADVNTGGGGGASTTIATMPADYAPDLLTGAKAFTADGGGSYEAFSVDDHGIITGLTDGLTNMAMSCRYMSKIQVPPPLSCWPKLIATKLPKVLGILVMGVTDAGSGADTTTRPAGPAYSVDFSIVLNKGQNQIKINNILGLPYNRKSHIRLLVIGTRS